MNNAIFIGRLGKPAELKTLEGGKQVINFSIAVDDGKDRPPIWIDCARWSEKAGILPYLLKGTQVAVSGTIGLRKWDGGAAITLRVDKIELLGSKPEGTGTERVAASPTASDISEPESLPF